MTENLGRITCQECNYTDFDHYDLFEKEPPRDANAPYGTIEFVCPKCGAKNQLLQDKEDLRLEMLSPKDAKEMRESIISILRRLYPTRTGYNGGHLAPIRDPNPELFFSVLHQLETEGVIEYNDTQIALRLSDSYIKNSEATA